MLKLLGIVTVFALTACDQKAASREQIAAAPAVAPAVPPAKPEQLVLSPEAIGPIAFGNTVAEMEKQLGQAVRLDQADNPECSYITFAAVPKVRLMVEKGVITRADVEREIGNSSGLRVGDAEAQLKEKLPALKPQPHKYVQGGHVFTMPGQGQSAMVIETDGSKITSIRAGLQPAVSYVEGCG